MQRRAWEVAYAVALSLFLAVAALAGCSRVDEGRSDVGGIAYAGGEITEAQYRQLVATVRQCMVDKGYDAGPLELRHDGLTYGFVISGGPVGDTSTSFALHDCEAPLNFADGEIAYTEQNMLAGAQREQVYAELIDCLAEAGMPGVTPQESREDITQRLVRMEAEGHDIEPAWACIDQYGSRIFGVGT